MRDCVPAPPPVCDRPVGNSERQTGLAEAALALDQELRRYEDLAEQAARVKLNTEKNLERATEALTRAAESQDRINAHVQKLVAAVAAARQKQEADAAALMARAQQIAARRQEFAGLLQRMAGLGESARDLQELLKGGPDRLDEIEARMQQVAEEAAGIAESASQKEMEDLARQAGVLRQQVLAARNKVALLAKKPSA
jgi:DNA repair exonuclease SbcCD ATPase subunit